ncbi:MAG TPA: PRC-barrel domain-containing protein [Longimicrobium sp.]|nr:PRC-barrel domain-containing protein [Longimicrobium sp.]
MTETTAPRAEVLRTRDIVGWHVQDRDGSKVGDVADLLFGRDGTVRFLAVNLGLFRKQVLIPADRVEWGAGALVVSAWTNGQMKALPAYDAAAPITATVLAEMESAHPRFYSGEPEPQTGGTPRIVPLSEARDFKLASGAPDLRAWTVFAGDNERVGEIREMLVDPDAMKVRFVSVDLADDLFNLHEDRHVLVPMEVIELRERGKDAWVQGTTAKQISVLPAYTGGAVEPWMERAVLHAFGLAAPDYDEVQ